MLLAKNVEPFETDRAMQVEMWGRKSSLRLAMEAQRQVRLPCWNKTLRVQVAYGRARLEAVQHEHVQHITFRYISLSKHVEPRGRQKRRCKYAYR